VHDSGPLLLCLLALAVVVVAIQSWRLGRQREIAEVNRGASDRESERRSAAQARSLRAVDGEQEAGPLLERFGYTVIARQVLGSWTVRADGEPATFDLRADYLVTREGRRYIAEVKTGRLAPRLSHGPTRRQLLEYAAAFDVHGVILVDADAAEITHVDMDLFSGAARANADREGRGITGITRRMLAVAILVSFSIGVLGGVLGGVIVGRALVGEGPSSRP
jgi:hypothetical protein